MADRAFLETELIRLTQAIRSVRRAIEIQEANGASTAELRATLRDYEGQLSAVQKQLALLSAQPPAASAGEITAQEQRARDDGALPIAPGPPVGETPTPPPPSNADTFPAPPPADTGTDAPGRPYRITNALPPNTAPPRGVPPAPTTGGSQGPNDDNQGPRTTTQPGVGAGSEDSSGSAPAAGSGPNTRSTLNSLFGDNIVPQANILDAYASYTYNISIYLMSPADLRRFYQTESLPQGAQLLIQSGGAPTGGGLINPGQLDPNIEDPLEAARAQRVNLGRNEFFSLDYYIDDVKLVSALNGKGTRSAHNNFTVDFKVIEPNGISFLYRLRDACQRYVQLSGSPQTNFAAQNYLMVIRFYGYDKDGKLVTGQGQPFTDPVSGQTINTISEKYIPFLFRNITFRVANRITEYQCECVATSHQIPLSSTRGTIQYNVEFVSQSLEDLLNGAVAFAPSGRVATEGRSTTAPATGTRGQPASADPNFNGNAQGLTESEVVPGFGGVPSTAVAASSTALTQAPPKASAQQTKTLVTGLRDALNRQQDEWVATGAQEFADRYFFEIDPLLKQATIVPPGRTNLRQTPMSPNATARDKALPATQAMDPKARKFDVVAGTSITQFLDQVTRNSSYIYDQQIKYFDPVTNKQIPVGNPANITGWYRISMQAVPQGANRYDRKRNDYAYDITYRIEVYAINDAKSDYFPPSRYRGVHKQYRYWFTGENTQILDYQQNFNNIYYLVTNSGTQPKTRTNNWLTVPMYFPQPRSNETDQMNTGKVSEPSAQLADFLYSPADTNQVKIRIVGDPSLIQQGEIRGQLPKGRNMYGPFLPDGTINYAGQEVLFEIAFNRPVDYDLTTGLMDTSKNNFNANQAAGRVGDPQDSNVYRASFVTSYFSRGKFEQDLEGNQILFDIARVISQASRDADAQPGGFYGTTSTDNLSRQPLADKQPPGLPPNLAFGNLAQGPFVSTNGIGSFDNAAASPFIIGTPNPQPVAADQPPTSSGQPIGPASSADPYAITSSVRAQGGAAGPAVGAPQVPVILNNTQQIDVTSAAEIQALLAADQITPFAASVAQRRLSQIQEAAASPQSARSPQLIAKD